ncbi:hypothetical protein ABT346_09160 [Micromonospora peucetia]|uniref:hypothetical protein n=1 Tax=Micromonospora peucetia TaxID=47871 RepID=UPI003324A95D
MEVEASQELEASGVRARAEMLSAEEDGATTSCTGWICASSRPELRAFEVAQRRRKQVCVQADAADNRLPRTVDFGMVSSMTF